MEFEFGVKYATKNGDELKFITRTTSGDYQFLDNDGDMHSFSEDEINELNFTRWGETKRLYVLVNNHLSTVYGCVQGGHAVAKYLIDNSEQTWDNQYLIYLSADTVAWARKLSEMGVPYSEWREPDMDNFLTAIACRDDSGTLFIELNTVR
jgi:hypothetical protein